MLAVASLIGLLLNLSIPTVPLVPPAPLYPLPAYPLPPYYRHRHLRPYPYPYHSLPAATSAWSELVWLGHAGNRQPVPVQMWEG